MAKLCSSINSATLPLTVVLQAFSERNFRLMSTENEVKTDWWVVFQFLGGFVSI